MLQEAERYHWQELKKTAGIAVHYKRGDEGIELTAVPGKGGNDPLRFGGQAMQDESKSFLLGTAELLNFFPPRKGDVIHIRNTEQNYTVRQDATGAAHTESGNYGVFIRVHVVQ